MQRTLNQQLESMTRAENELIKIQLAGLQEAANPMIIATRAGKIVWANCAFEELTRYSAQEAIGRDTRLLRSGMQSNSFYAELWKTVLSGNKWRGELINHRKDGSWYDEEMTITPLRDKRAEISHFLAIKLDIIERRRQGGLNLLLAQAVENTSELIGIANHEGVISFVNGAFRRMIGATNDDLLGRHFGVFLSPNNPPGLNEKIAATSFGEGWRGECLVPRSDGTDIPVHLSSSAIKDAEGKILGVIGIAQRHHDPQARGRSASHQRRAVPAVGRKHPCRVLRQHARSAAGDLHKPSLRRNLGQIPLGSVREAGCVDKLHSSGRPRSRWVHFCNVDEGSTHRQRVPHHSAGWCRAMDQKPYISSVERGGEVLSRGGNSGGHY